MRLAIELADAGLSLCPEEGEASAPSPGIAIVDGETHHHRPRGGGTSPPDAAPAPQPFLAGHLHRGPRPSVRTASAIGRSRLDPPRPSSGEKRATGSRASSWRCPGDTARPGSASSSGSPVRPACPSTGWSMRRSRPRSGRTATGPCSTSISSSTGRSSPSSSPAPGDARSSSPIGSGSRGCTTPGCASSPGSSSRPPDSIRSTRRRASRTSMTVCRPSSTSSAVAGLDHGTR